MSDMKDPHALDAGMLAAEKSCRQSIRNTAYLLLALAENPQVDMGKLSALAAALPNIEIGPITIDGKA